MLISRRLLVALSFTALAISNARTFAAPNAPAARLDTFASANGEAYFAPYVEPLSEARMLLAACFNSMLAPILTKP